MLEHLQNLYQELQVDPLVSEGGEGNLDAMQKIKIELPCPLSPLSPLFKGTDTKEQDIHSSLEDTQGGQLLSFDSAVLPDSLESVAGGVGASLHFGTGLVHGQNQRFETNPTAASQSAFGYSELELKRSGKDLSAQEKLQQNGVKYLSNIELLCLLLGSGNRQQSVEQLARQVYKQLAREPFASSLESLQSIKGMGMGKSCAILAALELARRLLSSAFKPKQLNSPAAIHQQIAHFADQQENLVAINLNGACEALSVRLITRGTINRSLIHPREVFTHAIREQAHSVVVAHNHPSGDLAPSSEDLASTRRLQAAAEVLGLTLLDHIVFSHNNYLSFAEQGLLQTDS